MIIDDNLNSGDVITIDYDKEADKIVSKIDKPDMH